MSKRIDQLPAATTVSDADVFAISQGGAAKSLPYSAVRAAASADVRWSTVPTASYTSTPASTSTITMSSTALMAVGLPVKYTYNSVTYYGIVTAITANTSITIAGAPLDTGQDLSALYVGTPEMVQQIVLFVSSTYGDGTGDLLASDMNTYFEWAGAKSYLVAFKATHKTAAGTTQPKVNVKVNAAAVSTNDSNLGVQLTTAGAWVSNSAVAINTSNYDINRGEALDVNCTAAGNPTSGAANLTVICTFVNG